MNTPPKIAHCIYPCPQAFMALIKCNSEDGFPELNAIDFSHLLGAYTFNMPKIKQRYSYGPYI